MACEPTNITEAKLHRSIINGHLFFKLQPNQTVEETLKFNKAVQDSMKPSERTFQGKEQRYTFLGETIKGRVSDKAKNLFRERRGAKRAEMLNNRPDSLAMRETGIRIHKIMEELVDYHYNNKGNIDDIRIRAQKGDYSVSADQFRVLSKTARRVIRDITSIQREIDPNKKATILTENMTVDPVKNIGGTMDITAFFSDNTAAVYDYKTKKAPAGTFNGTELIDDIIQPYDEDAYELTMGEYKRQLKERLGVASVRRSRVVPIHVQLEKLPFARREEGRTLSKKIRILQSDQEYLKQLPVAGEKTRYKGLNKLLERQWVLLNKWMRTLHKEKISAAEADRLRTRIRTMKKSINSLITEGDIRYILENMRKVTIELSYYQQPEYKANGEVNPKYIDDRTLRDLVAEASIYEDISNLSASYFQKLRSASIYKELRSKLSGANVDLQRTLSNARIERDQRILEHVDNESDYYDEEGEKKALAELGFFESNFDRFSEIDHPIFRSAWPLIQDANRKKRKSVLDMNDEVAEKTNNLHQWAKGKMSRKEAYGKLINYETGNFYGKLTPEFYEERDRYLYDDSLAKSKAIAGMKKLYEIRDKDTFRKEFKVRAEKQRRAYEIEYGEKSQEAHRRMQFWLKQNDLLGSDMAWLNTYSLQFLRIKPKVEQENYSKEYKYIMENKPLKDYYNMFVKYNNEFREIFGIKHYRRLPDNFIPNIRKNMTDYLVNSDGSVLKKLKGAAKEFADSFRVRTEDVQLGDRDASGEFHRNIPIFFLQPLRNKDGDIDNTQKSYDLSQSIMLFGDMAYNYKYMHEIEPKIQAIKALIGDPSAEQAGVEATDHMGHKIKGKINEWATKKGITTNTYKLFEDLTDFHLYGIRHKTRSFTKKFNSTKVLSRLKNAGSIVALSFAVIPAAGAWIAGRTGMIFEGTKEVGYRNRDWVDAKKLMAKDFNKYRSFAAFFETYAENPIERLAQKRSTNWLKRWTDPRVLFAPLRKVDENIHNNIAAAMAHNWGIDPETKKLVRLNKPGAKKGIKSLAEASKFDKKTGKFIVDNLTDENYNQFREAVRTTAGNVIGSLSEDDIARFNANLVLGLMMQFKTWMPGIVKERLGPLRYDKKLQSISIGRYRNLLSEWSRTDEEIEDGVKVLSFIGKVVIPNLTGLIIDIGTFGLMPKLGRKRIKMDRAKAQYYKWIMENQKLESEVSFEDFLAIKQGQMKAMIREVRTIIGFITLISFLGGKSDDGEPRYMETWITRNLYKALTKGQSELSFMWNPSEFWRIVQNPIPLTFYLSNVRKALVNMTQELIVYPIQGERDPHDKTPFPYYLLQTGPGGSQVMRVVEFYEQYKQSPYD